MIFGFRWLINIVLNVIVRAGFESRLQWEWRFCFSANRSSLIRQTGPLAQTDVCPSWIHRQRKHWQDVTDSNNNPRVHEATGDMWRGGTRAGWGLQGGTRRSHAEINSEEGQHIDTVDWLRLYWVKRKCPQTVRRTTYPVWYPAAVPTYSVGR